VYFVHTPCEPGIEQVSIATIDGTLDVVVLHRSSCGELDSLEYMPVSGETPPREFPSSDALCAEPT
jgi:hypothetical protein